MLTIVKKEERIMDQEKIRELIQKGREFVSAYDEEYEDYLTDQEKKLPQPPLAKAPMTGNIIDLPAGFEQLKTDSDFLRIVNRRQSRRIYAQKGISLGELSYLLWCTQGVKSIRGKSYATLRTVPCGGARHEFECYLAIRNVQGLKAGLYHYLPMGHKIEMLGTNDDLEGFISDSLCGQSWASKADVVFYYSAVFYRAEWRYGIYAHPVILIDSGHITENLYLAAESLRLGGCAVAAIDGRCADEAFGLDGVEETIFLAMPVGTVDEKDLCREDDIYAFVKEQGL